MTSSGREAMKWIAVLLMTGDHVAKMLCGGYIPGVSEAGRVAFPLFALVMAYNLCKTPPVVTGDAALGMVASQAWATRCAVEAGSSAKVTGDIGDCASPFTVEGDTPEAHQLRAMRAERCSAPDWAKAGAGDGNTGNPHDGAEGVDGPGNSTWTFDVDVLDTSGFGGGSCPQLGTLDFGSFGAVALDGATWWCPLIAGLRAVMLLMGVFIISFRILFGE